MPNESRESFQLPEIKAKLPTPKTIIDAATNWLDGLSPEQIHTPADLGPIGMDLGFRVGKRIALVFGIDPAKVESGQQQTREAFERAVATSIVVANEIKKYVETFAPKQKLIAAAIGAYGKGLSRHIQSEEGHVDT